MNKPNSAIAAQCWCEPETENKEMDVVLAGVFVKRLDEKDKLINAHRTAYLNDIDTANKIIGDKDRFILELQEFAIWMTGCGYEFTQHDYFCKQRDKLLIGIDNDNPETE